jgi:hypothetical protein
LDGLASAITGLGLDSPMCSRQIPTWRLGLRRVLGAAQATRNPMLLLRLSRELLFRYAERQFLGLLFQEPLCGLAQSLSEKWV